MLQTDASSLCSLLVETVCAEAPASCAALTSETIVLVVLSRAAGISQLVNVLLDDITGQTLAHMPTRHITTGSHS